MWSFRQPPLLQALGSMKMRSRPSPVVTLHTGKKVKHGIRDIHASELRSFEVREGRQNIMYRQN